MKRVVLALIILELVQFVYFSYQIDLIKGVVTQNAATANQRAQASVVVALEVQKQLDQLKNSK